MRGEQATPTPTNELRRRRWSSVHDKQAESDSEDVPRNILSCTRCQSLEQKHLRRQDFGWKNLRYLDLSGCIEILPNAILEAILKLKHLKFFKPPLLERRYAEHGFSRLLRTPELRTSVGLGLEHAHSIALSNHTSSNNTLSLMPSSTVHSRDSQGSSVKEWKQCKKQERQLEGYTKIETMIEIRCAPGNPEEDEMKQGERMAIRVTNIANIVLFALKVFASIESKSLSIIASILEPFFDLLWGFILWLTSHAMQNPNPHKYPIGKKRMQPVGMIVFGSFGLQLLFQAAKQFITKAEPDKDPQKEKWMIGVMTFVTMVQLMLAFYCRRFENKIVRAYAEHHSSNVKTNLISLPAAVLAIRYYWWIDPTGAIIILLYTMNAWKKTFFESLFALIGRTAPPEFLEMLEVLIRNHHEDIKNIDTLIVYTFSSDLYFVEVEIVLPQDMVLSKAHDIGETLKEKLKQLPEVERAFVEMSCSFS